MAQFSILSIFILCVFSHVLAQNWDASNYPNPTGSGFAQCNMRSRALVCDPDQVLSESERQRLNYELNQLEASTRQPNGQNFCEKKGIVVGIALAKNVRGGSENAVKTMSNEMLRTWTLDEQCSKSAIIVISTNDRKFWAGRDSRVPVYGAEFTDIFNSVRGLFKDSRYGEALLNVIGDIRQRALAKQTSSGGEGPPFNPKTPPNYPEPNKPKGSGFSFPKIPFWFWILLIVVIIPTLCCCCCLYCCCCRNKNDGTPRRQGPADLPNEGGYPSAPTRGGGGGGLQGFLGGMGGAAIGNTISSFFNRNRNPQQPVPTSRPTYDDPPPYNAGRPGGGPLYPSVNVKDEGGGGGW